MKTKVLALFLTLLSSFSCAKSTPPSSNKDLVIQEKKDSSPIFNCENESTAFACVQKACLHAGANFNEETNTCECNPGEVFYIGDGGNCKLPSNEFNDDTITYQYTYKNNLVFYVQSMTEETSKAELNQLVKTLSIPIYPGKIIINFFSNKTEIVGPALRDNFNMASPLTELTRKNINSGVLSAQLNESRQALFIPNKNFNILNFKNIGGLKNLLAKTDLFQLNFEKSKSQFIFFSENKCAEICYETNKIELDENYEIEKFQTISGGNPYETGYRVYLKNNSQPQAYIVTHQNYISHIYILKNDLSIDVVSNRDEIIKTISAPNKLSDENKSISKRLPIALFESDYHQNADSVALRGPYLDQTYLGWFKTSEKPYFFGRTASLIGEEDFTSFEHSYKVSQIASDNFNTPLILLPPRSLLFGDLQLIQKRFSQPIIASISIAYTMTMNTCNSSEIVKTIRNTKKSIFWVVGAGNSGKSESKSTFEMCPQALNEENLLLVSSTSHKSNQLSRETSFGENFSDIAVSGCEYKDTEINPTCSLAGTSFAAPRFAQLIRKLSLKNPNKQFGELKLAFLFTAQYDDSPLPIKSGGVANLEDAHRFLSQFSDVDLTNVFNDSKTDLKSDSYKKLVKILSEIYKERYLWKYESKAKKHIERIQQNY